MINAHIHKTRETETPLSVLWDMLRQTLLEYLLELYNLRCTIGMALFQTSRPVRQETVDARTSVLLMNVQRSCACARWESQKLSYPKHLENLLFQDGMTLANGRCSVSRTSDDVLLYARLSPMWIHGVHISEDGSTVRCADIFAVSLGIYSRDAVP